MKTMTARQMIGSPLILVPAYGMTYATEEAMRIDWVNGRDFKIKGGPYCSIRDLDKLSEDASSIWIYDLISKHTICVA